MGVLHSGLMGDVCGPALKSIQTTRAPHCLCVRGCGGVKETQMLQLLHQNQNTFFYYINYIIHCFRLKQNGKEQNNPEEADIKKTN